MIILKQLQWELKNLKKLLPMKIKYDKDKYGEIPLGYIVIKKKGGEKYGYLRCRENKKIKEKYIGNVNTAKFIRAEEALKSKKSVLACIEEYKRQIASLEFAIDTIIERENSREKKICQVS